MGIKMRCKKLQSLIQNHKREKRSESVPERRIALYKSDHHHAYPYRIADAHLMLVGKSSGVKKKTEPNMPEAPTIPSMAATTDSVASTEFPAKPIRRRR